MADKDDQSKQMFNAEMYRKVIQVRKIIIEAEAAKFDIISQRQSGVFTDVQNSLVGELNHIISELQNMERHATEVYRTVNEQNIVPLQSPMPSMVEEEDLSRYGAHSIPNRQVQLWLDDPDYAFLDVTLDKSKFIGYSNAQKKWVLMKSLSDIEKFKIEQNPECSLISKLMNNVRLRERNIARSCNVERGTQFKQNGRSRNDVDNLLRESQRLVQDLDNENESGRLSSELETVIRGKESNQKPTTDSSSGFSSANNGGRNSGLRISSNSHLDRQPSRPRSTDLLEEELTAYMLRHFENESSNKRAPRKETDLEDRRKMHAGNRGKRSEQRSAFQSTEMNALLWPNNEQRPSSSVGKIRHPCRLNDPDSNGTDLDMRPSVTERMFSEGFGRMVEPIEMSLSDVLAKVDQLEYELHRYKLQTEDRVDSIVGCLPKPLVQKVMQDYSERLKRSHARDSVRASRNITEPTSFVENKIIPSASQNNANVSWPHMNVIQQSRSPPSNNIYTPRQNNVTSWSPPQNNVSSAWLSPQNNISDNFPSGSRSVPQRYPQSPGSQSHMSIPSTNLNSMLNNQVAPGTRANNYWDNFRSYSRQNMLANPKANASPRFVSLSPMGPYDLSHSNANHDTATNNFNVGSSRAAKNPGVGGADKMLWGNSFVENIALKKRNKDQKCKTSYCCFSEGLGDVPVVDSPTPIPNGASVPNMRELSHPETTASSEIKQFIQENSSRPQYMKELFQKLSLMKSDYMRQRTMSAIEDLVMRYGLNSNDEHVQSFDADDGDGMDKIERSQAEGACGGIDVNIVQAPQRRYVDNDDDDDDDEDDDDYAYVMNDDSVRRDRIRIPGSRFSKQIKSSTSIGADFPLSRQSPSAFVADDGRAVCRPSASTVVTESSRPVNNIDDGVNSATTVQPRRNSVDGDSELSERTFEAQVLADTQLITQTNKHNSEESVASGSAMSRRHLDAGEQWWINDEMESRDSTEMPGNSHPMNKPNSDDSISSNERRNPDGDTYLSSTKAVSGSRESMRMSGSSYAASTFSTEGDGSNTVQERRNPEGHMHLKSPETRENVPVPGCSNSKSKTNMTSKASLEAQSLTPVTKSDNYLEDDRSDTGIQNENKNQEVSSGQQNHSGQTHERRPWQSLNRLEAGYWPFPLPSASLSTAEMVSADDAERQNGVSNDPLIELNPGRPGREPGDNRRAIITMQGPRTVTSDFIERVTQLNASFDSIERLPIGLDETGLPTYLKYV